ncbi:malonic semialdehyde reductase [Polymorphobacter megasporae]|uniref:malonic semialdehyde reductase n=1 Tax=Glacieibacterium megasporae TaxID=2835787 RepID=UPI001C1E165A|nr:malonic semialdehyde reductase [Polymorphobacter megasporae]UAJ10524.1 malonic semialdehyde reductase [Polymorphobacter megasporae]
MSVAEEALLAKLFRAARSQNGWKPDPVGDDELEAAYDIAKWGPTSMNTQPMRAVIIRSPEAKERLRLALAPTNVEKAMTAPVVALIAYDTEFYTHLPRTFPHNPNAEAYFTGNPASIEPTAFRNGSLQAAYFMLALRAVGLDVGPMSGFDPAVVNDAFFAGSSWRINLVCCIGHGDPSRIFDRSPRMEYSEIFKTG